jgi:hypothetical protein
MSEEMGRKLLTSMCISASFLASKMLRNLASKLYVRCLSEPSKFGLETADKDITVQMCAWKVLNKPDKKCGLDSAGSFECSNNASHCMSGLCVCVCVSNCQAVQDRAAKS